MFAAVLSLCSALAATVPAPQYATRQLILEVDSTEVSHLRKLAEASLDEHGIKQLLVREEGQTRPITTGMLTAPMAAAVLATLAGDARNAEHDLVFPSSDGRVAISVWWLPGPWRLELEVGAALPTSPVRSASRQDLDALWVGPLVEEDRTWNRASMGLVAEAWAMLRPEERQLLSDLPLHRRSAPTREELRHLGRGPGTHLEAIYREDGDGACIVLFDAALSPTGLFSGSAQQPRFAGLLTLLHEVAHALATTEARRERVAFETISREAQAAIDTYNAAVDDYNDRVTRSRGKDPTLQERIDAINRMEADLVARNARQVEAAENVNRLTAGDTAMARAFRSSFRGLAVTWYAQTSSEEALAEAFSLARVDPEALRRISPEALAWFERGEHLAFVPAPTAD